jgi:hypothetical protein
LPRSTRDCLETASAHSKLKRLSKLSCLSSCSHDGCHCCKRHRRHLTRSTRLPRLSACSCTPVRLPPVAAPLAVALLLLAAGSWLAVRSAEVWPAPGEPMGLCSCLHGAASARCACAPPLSVPSLLPVLLPPAPAPALLPAPLATDALCTHAAACAPPPAAPVLLTATVLP